MFGCFSTCTRGCLENCYAWLFFVPSALQSVEIQLSQQVRGKTDALDALGNTTAATGKVRVKDTIE